MENSNTIKEALELYSRGLISRSTLESEFDRCERQQRSRSPSGFWRPGTVDLSRDPAGVWRARQ